MFQVVLLFGLIGVVDTIRHDYELFASCHKSELCHLRIHKEMIHKNMQFILLIGPNVVGARFQCCLIKGEEMSQFLLAD